MSVDSQWCFEHSFSTNIQWKVSDKSDLEKKIPTILFGETFFRTW